MIVVAVRLTSHIVNGHKRLLCPVSWNGLMHPDGNKDG